MLFNRGECFRRIGDADHAVDDYREFLEKVPNAPNRADIEAKIVAIEAPEPPVAKAPPPPAAPVAKAPPPPPRRSRRRRHRHRAVAKAPPRAGREGAAGRRRREGPPPPPEPQQVTPPLDRRSPRPAAALAETKPAPAVTVRRAAPPADAARTGGSRPWVWVALSVLVVGAGVAGFLVFRPHDQPPPATALGNYRF